MANDILKNIPLPADLPENWTSGQIVAPTGAEAGLDDQHGYNYLMTQVNNAQKAAKALNEGKLSPSGGTMTGPLILNDGGTAVGIQENAGAHNSIYRGKNLGTKVTEAQWAEIKAGTFRDLFIGDYWTISGRNWRIGAFDYWYLCGDTSCDAHHALIVPDAHLYTASMNPTNTTEGAYIGSQMYKTGLTEAKDIVNAAFGSDHILVHRELFQNAVSNGKPSGGAWYDSTVELMNEVMVYGTRHCTALPDGSSIPNNHTTSKSQLPLFRLAPWLSFTRSYWCWLRDVVSAAYFADASNYGYCSYDYASRDAGVRPAFAIY